MDFIIKNDCYYFKGDRPCVYHKESGIVCSSCHYYKKIKIRILIIKLDAVGDVLRTTSILKGIHENYDSVAVYWLTRSEAISVLRNNPYIFETIPFGVESLLYLSTMEFDLVINLDASKTSSMLAKIAKGKRKLGFCVNEHDSVYPMNGEATEWFFMGLNDALKRQNNKTYHEIIHEIVGIKSNNYHPSVYLDESDKIFSERFKTEKGLHSSRIIGINTGSGSRWKSKRWTLDYIVKLIKLLNSHHDFRILLLGGPEEVKRNNEILSRSNGNIIDTGCKNSLREFVGIINCCDLLVTGDTLALHIGVGLNKKVIAIFGPTSAPEIDLFGRGVKLIPDGFECKCCYRHECNSVENCMDYIKPETVYNAILSLV